MNKLVFCPVPKEVEIDYFKKFKLSIPLTVCDGGLNLKIACSYLPFEVNFCDNAQITVHQDKKMGLEDYILEVNENGVFITARESQGASYALLTLKQILTQAETEIPFLKITDSPHFKIRGFMLDISRDKVPTLETLKERADILFCLKNNHFELYIEGAPFEYRDYPDMWTGFELLKGEEIAELDRYCKERFIDLVPAQNTFGHMGKWLFDGGYSHLAECPNGFISPQHGRFVPWPMCLDPQNEEGFELVKNISDDLLSFFSSENYNVCCDETLELGVGKSKELCEKLGIGRVYFDYLMKLYNYCKQKGRRMLFWADIINEYPEIVKELPRDVLVLNWGYYNDLPKEQSCIEFEKNEIPYCVCPGTAVWNTYIGNIPQMLENTKTTILKGYRHSAVGVVNTEWGDGGHLQGTFSAYPGLVYGAAMSWQPVINENLDIAEVLNKIVFEDNASLIGEVFLKAGDFISKEGVRFENSSHAEILLKSNISTAKPDERFTHNDYNRVIDYLLSVKELLKKVDLKSDDKTVTYELEVGIDLVITAQNIGKYLLYRAENDKENLRLYGKTVYDGLNSALTNLTKLWIEKNKISRLIYALSPILNNASAVKSELCPENKQPE